MARDTDRPDVGASQPEQHDSAETDEGLFSWSEYEAWEAGSLDADPLWMLEESSG